MSYTSKQSQESHATEQQGAKPTAQLFNDQRLSTSTQLKQQQMMNAVQRMGTEEEEPLQGEFATTQRAALEEEEPIQGKFDALQRASTEEEEPLQGKFNSTAPVQLETKPNNTGLPDNLKSGIENMSGYSMDDVKVHYNSDKPAQLNAHAYAQGTDIHVAPGQEQHLPHEAWHVVQQKQGRVQPTMQMKASVPVNDDAGLEHEADVMGARAITPQATTTVQPIFTSLQSAANPLQMVRYSIERSIKLELGTKEWEEQKAEPDKGINRQSAKTRARGQALAHLREIYPDDGTYQSTEEKDSTRGLQFAEAKRLLDEKYKILDSDPEDQKATSTRTAIYKDAPEGSRANSTQANGVKALTGDDQYIGAHLIKREWGGADNMWNVVAWQKSAEDIWAKGFERAVDMKGVFGEDPGTVSIKVQKEDEYLDKNAHEAFVNGKNLNKTGMEMIAETRHGINRAIESVPLSASGTNFEKTTTLDGATIGYDLATGKALEKLKEKVNAATLLKDERNTYAGKRPLPNDLQEAEDMQNEKRLKERKIAWKSEKDTYEKGGKDAFEFENTLFKE